MGKIQKTKIFEVYEDKRGRLYTINLTPGKKVYDERLVKEEGVEYRSWDGKKRFIAFA